MTRVAIIRHGVTDWNEEGRLQGNSDIPLNEAGHRQAKALAVRFQSGDWDLVYASDLQRAAATARYIAEQVERPLRLDRRLREISHGDLEGTTLQERIKYWGELWREQEHGVESEASRDRGVEAITQLANIYPGKRILLVSHGGLIRHTLRKLLQQEQPVHRIQNTAMTLLELKNARWKCLLFNCTSHLDTATK